MFFNQPHRKKNFKNPTDLSLVINQLIPSLTQSHNKNLNKKAVNLVLLHDVAHK